MKKGFIILITLILLILLIDGITTKGKTDGKVEGMIQKEGIKKEEIRAFYISYIELNKYLDGKSKEAMVGEINRMVENIKQEKFNWILLHTRSFSDSIYPSQVFPSAYSITRDEDKKLEVDILNEFIKSAHAKNIKVHAWINPYRIRNEEDFSSISEANPCFKWIGTDKVKRIEGKGIFYNPASDEVQNLIVRGIKEIVLKYPVDGIHLDDYFYPDKTIDLGNYQEYQASGGELSIEKYRLENVNKLIRTIYQEIHNIDKNILFGISPDGNVTNNYQENYADILTWLKEDGYVDYIMPQLYYGFQNETKPFVETLNSWNNYIERQEIFLVPALALYKSGNIDEYAKSGREEWTKESNILKRQIQVSRKKEKYRGFALFRYDTFYTAQNDTVKKEIENIKTLLDN